MPICTVKERKGCHSVDRLPEVTESSYSARVAALVIGGLAAVILGGCALSTPTAIASVARAQARAGQQPIYRAVLRPIVGEVMTCMRVEQHTLHAVHNGAHLSGAALATYIHGPLTADVNAETAVCDREQRDTARRLAWLPRKARPAVEHAVLFEGRAALLGGYFLYSVTLPTQEQRDAFLGHATEDGAAMLRELRAFLVGVSALTGIAAPSF